MDCYILRKDKVSDLLGKYPEISQHLKYVVMKRYRQNIRWPIKAHREETESGLQFRSARKRNSVFMSGGSRNASSCHEVEEEEDA
mmetsp:Transcript_35740/g.26548  ORF Transcript_35740/g.26548 Transcript_35740/m.26548 type:complete len:85 (-) Transcript_35740:130-384(-)|eukprot:CAMPEP_0202961460 /NCGR_PEP_ID=MMETSP1396-20130829/5515_1 /ASSEMBLY_ACC=CAM_ASM_000872 /TAXON_ID= /ORGANISM="Pseudokeronopsis sp., Strain Brazil" /LENGTH=84 /DNA_ID=CAMNT_0049681289 /DNA_START=424 /DNA_END=678 /DNA_ORIENTATION=-